MEPTRVMVIDDEPIVCDRLKDHLEKDGFEVETFVKSAEALAALRSRPYDVVVTDLKMAGATGQDVLQTVRDSGFATQVIMISAYASSDALRDAEAVGAYEFLCKPFELKTLSKKVKAASRRARRTGPRPTAEEPR
jgi:DNA-binding NtrC family response regulator